MKAKFGLLIFLFCLPLSIQSPASAEIPTGAFAGSLHGLGWQGGVIPVKARITKVGSRHIFQYRRGFLDKQSYRIRLVASGIGYEGYSRNKLSCPVNGNGPGVATLLLVALSAESIYVIREEREESPLGSCFDADGPWWPRTYVGVLWAVKRPQKAK